LELKVPSGETNKVRKERIIELFGEENSNETPEPTSLGAVIVPSPARKDQGSEQQNSGGLKQSTQI